MAKKIFDCINFNTLQNIAKIIGDTEKGLTGSQICTYLSICNIEDIEPSLTKWKRLLSAFVNNQNKNQNANSILKLVQTVINPINFAKNATEYREKLNEINLQLAFIGLRLQENGKYCSVEKANTLEDLKARTENLKQELETRKSHSEVFKYCKEELLQNNYFHSVFEANKGLFERIRELSGVTTDGNTLIEQVFSKNNPILIINNNISHSEQDEQNGFCNLLKGLCSMFRNPMAHETKVEWEIGEQDALEILGIISYCHRRLDKAQRIR